MVHNYRVYIINVDYSPMQILNIQTVVDVGQIVFICQATFL